MRNSRTTALLMLLVFLLVVAVVIIFLTGLDNSNPHSNIPYQNVTATAEPEVPVETPQPTPVPTSAPTSAPVYYPPSTSAPVQTARPVATATPPSSAPSQTTGGSDPVMLPAEQLIPSMPAPSSVPDTLVESTPTPIVTGAPVAPVDVMPVGTLLGSGTFRSDTGTSLNIHADWNATVSGDRTVDITVSVYVDSYSLYTSASPNTLNIAVDGQYASLASPAIEYDGTDGLRVTLLNDRTFTVNLSSGELKSFPVEVAWMYRGTYGNVSLDTIECGGNISLTR